MLKSVTPKNSNIKKKINVSNTQTKETSNRKETTITDYYSSQNPFSNKAHHSESLSIPKVAPSPNCPFITQYEKELFKTMRSKSKKKGRKDSFTSFHSSKTFKDYQSLITKVREMFIPIEKEIGNKKNHTTNLSIELSKVKTTIDKASTDLNSLLLNNTILSKDTNRVSLEQQRLEIENEYMDKEILKLKKENALLVEQINDLDRKTVLYRNEYISISDNIEEMKREMKIKSMESNELIYQKRIIHSCLLIIRKKHNFLKQSLAMHNQKKNKIYSGFECLLSNA